MSPFQHGEVFVTDDGAETDLDLGHYERFTDISAKQSDNITTGRIYSDIIQREDIEICESVQASYEAKGFKNGIISKRTY